MSHNSNTNKRTAWNVKEPKKTNRSPDSGQVLTNPEAYDTLIKNHGVRVKVYRTMHCPNVKSVDGAEHEIDCDIPGCNGSGWVDVAPIETLAFIQNQSLEKMPFVEGQVDGNTVAATFLTGIELQYFTLVELIDFTDIFFQRVSRSNTNTDNLRYAAKRVNVIMDKNSKLYYQCIDFELDPNGNIKWKNGKGPMPGTIYSVHYESAVRFRATQAMHANRFGQKKVSGGVEYHKFPEQWALTKEFLVKRRDQDGNEIKPNDYEASED